MSKQVVKKEQAGALAAAADLSSWGSGQVISSNDIIIPKIWVMQYMSDKVKTGLAKYGEFRDSVNNDKFGDLETPMEVIPFHLEVKWMEYDVVKKPNGERKREYKQTIPVQNNPNLPGYNDRLPRVDMDGSVERDRVMDYYVLLPSELAAGGALPYVISFKRTSLKTGKKLALQMYVRNRDAGLVPPAVAFNLSAKSVSNDDGEFAVIEAATSRKSTDEELAEALKWWKQVQEGQAKVHDGSEEATEKDVTPF